jgi:hypothetical protein
MDSRRIKEIIALRDGWHCTANDSAKRGICWVPFARHLSESGQWQAHEFQGDLMFDAVRDLLAALEERDRQNTILKEKCDKLNTLFNMVTGAAIKSDAPKAGEYGGDA